MTVGIGASGILGLALEVTSGTYVPPIKYVPFLTESLDYSQATEWRRPIRQSADVIGSIAGNSVCSGDIEMEGFEDVIPYFMYSARTAVVKSGTTPNWIYTITPSASAVPIKTMSVTIVRNGIVFGYSGLVVGSWTLNTDNGILKYKASMVGTTEAVQSAPSPTWPTTPPYGAGSYSVEIPTASQVFDADSVEFQCDDNAAAQYRLKNTGTGAQFISFGERSVQLTTERDFQNRTEFDAFKALTAQSITFTASKGANNSVSLTVPSMIKDTYTVNLGGEGDLVRAAITYQGTIDNTGNSYTMVCKTQENIT